MRVAKVIPESLLDGVGINYTIFAQGCYQKCEGCHNPETWDFAAGKEYPDAFLVDNAAKHYLCDGVTFTGGEPLEQLASVMYIAKECRKRGFKITLYTGYTLVHLKKDCYVFARKCGHSIPFTKEMLDCFDVIVDGDFDKSLRRLDLPFRGSSNQRILRKEDGFNV